MSYRVLALLPILALVAACEQAGSNAPIGAQDLSGPEPLVEGVAEPTDGVANETTIN